jgi:hypothetical protein
MVLSTSYQTKTMIAYAIVRHRPDKKIVRAILSRVVADIDASGPSDPSDPRDPHEWRETFVDVLDNLDSRGYHAQAVLMRALADAGPCPHLITIPDILQMLEIDLPTSPR